MPGDTPGLSREARRSNIPDRLVPTGSPPEMEQGSPSPGKGLLKTRGVHQQPGLPGTCPPRPPACQESASKMYLSAFFRRGGMVGFGSGCLVERWAEREAAPPSPLPRQGATSGPRCSAVPRTPSHAGFWVGSWQHPPDHGPAYVAGAPALGVGRAGSVVSPPWGQGTSLWQRWRGAESCTGRGVGASAVGAWEGASRTTEKPRSGEWKSGHSVCTENHFPRELSVRSEQESFSHMDGQRVAIGQA